MNGAKMGRPALRARLCAPAAALVAMSPSCSRPCCGSSGWLAEGSLHAWTDVYLPGAGWVGMDATNGIFANHNFIPAAVGISPGDVTPIAGHFYPPQAADAQMTSRLELINL